jgi:signal transduction histidine kinase
VSAAGGPPGAPYGPPYGPPSGAPYHGPPSFARVTPPFGIPVAPGALASEPLDAEPRPLAVAIVTPDSALRATCAAVVADAGHTVQGGALAAATAAPALDALRPDLVLLDLATGDDALALVRHVHAAGGGEAPLPSAGDDARPPCYVLGVVSEACTRHLPAFVAAGGDDFVLVPATAERLGARLALAARRIVQVAAHLRAERALARAQWLAGIGETSIAIQHEINNPLAALLGHAALIEHGLVEPGEEREILGVVVEQAHRIGAVVKRLAALRDPRTVEYLRGARMLDLSKDAKEK